MFGNSENYAELDGGTPEFNHHMPPHFVLRAYFKLNNNGQIIGLLIPPFPSGNQEYFENIYI